jgi:carbon starvation protein CstA
LTKILLKTGFYWLVIAVIITRLPWQVIWRYFAFSNQTLATIVLWTAAMYLTKNEKRHWIVTIPATFMTAVCTTYILMAPEGFELSVSIAYPIGIVVAIIAFVTFYAYLLPNSKNIAVSED